jgi:hypothetical protein
MGLMFVGADNPGIDGHMIGIQTDRRDAFAGTEVF